MEQQSPSKKQNPFYEVLHWKWVIIGFAVILTAIALYWWPNSGFDGHDIQTNTHELKSLWDWLQLLIVPAVLAGGGILFSQAERRNEREISDKRLTEDRERADEREKLERELADERSKEEVIQVYFDRMSSLLLEHDLINSAPGQQVRTIARARTLSSVSRLDGRRKGSLVQFLYEAGLCLGTEPVVDLADSVLTDASLAYTSLTKCNLKKVDLRRSTFQFAKLQNGIFHLATLNNVDFSWADLTGADFHSSGVIQDRETIKNRPRNSLGTVDFNNATLDGADLRWASLQGACLIRTKLRNANLQQTDLRGAELIGADFSNATLDGAIYSESTKWTGAIISQVQLESMRKERDDPSPLPLE